MVPKISSKVWKVPKLGLWENHAFLWGRSKHLKVNGAMHFLWRIDRALTRHWLLHKFHCAKKTNLKNLTKSSFEHFGFFLRFFSMMYFFRKAQKAYPYHYTFCSQISKSYWKNFCVVKQFEFSAKELLLF